MSDTKFLIVVASFAIMFLVSKNDLHRLVLSGDEESSADRQLRLSADPAEGNQIAEDSDPPLDPVGVRRTEERKIAWLMTFPQSGARYIQRAIHEQTKTSTAVNFGQSLMDSNGFQRVSEFDNVPVFEDDWNGPFLFSTSNPLPKEGYVLTRTFCAGFCTECFARYYMQIPKDYLYECSVSSYYKDNEVVLGGHYDSSLVQKAVHLIRDPFTQIAARFKFEHRKWLVNGSEEKYEQYPTTRAGFEQYCKDQDYAQEMSLILDEERTWNQSEEGQLLSDLVPCHADLYRLIHWHNNLFYLRSNELVDVEFREIKYEDLIKNPQEELDGLYDFLGLTKVNTDLPPVDNIAENTDNYYTDEERDAIKRFIEYFGSDETVESLSIYLE